MTASLTPSERAPHRALDEELGSGDQGDEADHEPEDEVKGPRAPRRRMRAVRGGRLGVTSPRVQHPDCIGDAAQHQQDPVRAGEDAVTRQHVQSQSGDHHGRQVEPQRPALERDGHEQRREAQDEQQIDQVGADDVADRERRASAACRIDADRQLGKARADRDHGQADHHRRKPQSRGQARSGTHQELGADQQRDEPSDDEQDGHALLMVERCKVDTRSRLGNVHLLGRGLPGDCPAASSRRGLRSSYTAPCDEEARSRPGYRPGAPRGRPVEHVDEHLRAASRMGASPLSLEWCRARNLHAGRGHHSRDRGCCDRAHRTTSESRLIPATPYIATIERAWAPDAGHATPPLPGYVTWLFGRDQVGVEGKARLERRRCGPSSPPASSQRSPGGIVAATHVVREATREFLCAHHRASGSTRPSRPDRLIRGQGLHVPPGPHAGPRDAGHATAAYMMAAGRRTPGGRSDQAPHSSDKHAWHLGVHVAGRSRLLMFVLEKRLLERVEREPMFEECGQDHPERPMEVPLQDGLTGETDPFALRRFPIRGDPDRVSLRAAAFPIELDSRTGIP